MDESRRSTATQTDTKLQKLEDPLRNVFGQHVDNIDAIDWESTTREFVGQLRKVGLDIVPYQEGSQPYGG